MNLKIANLVAIQFGIFVGIMSWLAYSHFESAKPPRVAEESRKGPVNSVAPVAPVGPVAPVTDPEGPRPETLDYRVNPDRAQPITEPPVPAVQYQYSREAVQQYTALAAQQYYQQIAPRPHSSSSVQDRSTSARTSYAKVEQEPAVVQLNQPAPQTVAYDEPAQVAYEEPAQIVAYAQPYPFIAYANARSFGRRCPPPRRHGVLTPAAHRRHDRTGLRLSGFAGFSKTFPPPSLGIVQRRDTDASSCRPTQSFKHRGKR